MKVKLLKVQVEYFLKGSDIYTTHNGITTKTNIKVPEGNYKAMSLVRKLNKEKTTQELSYIGDSKREKRLQKLREKRRKRKMKIDISGISIEKENRTEVIRQVKSDNYWKSVKIKEVGKDKISLELSSLKWNDQVEISEKIDWIMENLKKENEQLISIKDDYKVTFQE